MKATLEFNLEDFEEQQTHLRCVLALDMALCIWDFKEELIKGLERKYEMGLDEDFDVIDYLRQGLGDILDNHGVNLDKLIS